MKSHTVEGVVIKRMNVGEADRVITLFTKTKGKVSAIAKGVRKLTSKRAGSLELFNLVKAQVVEGKGSLDTLAEVQLIASFESWRKHIGRVNLAYQMCEAVDKLTADNEPSPVVFSILVTALTQIGTLTSNWEEQVSNWLVEIVKDLGFFPADKKFTGDIAQFIEQVSSRSYNSPRILQRLK